MSARSFTAAISLVFTLASASTASAQIGQFSINSNGDLSDDNPGDNICNTGFMVGGLNECTLRAAIEESNAKAGVDFIIISGFIATDTNGFVQITPQTNLPDITDTAVLDFTGAPGYASGNPFATPIVQLDGSQFGGGTGIRFSSGSGSSQLKALAIHSFDIRGVDIVADFVTVQGCQIGIADGQFVAGISGHAILSSGDDDWIGQQFNANLGWTGKGNVVSNNLGHGVILSVGAQRNLVAGNRIGTDPTGTLPMGNGGYGVLVTGDENEIGAVGTLNAGGDVASGNLISDNSNGVVLDIEATGNTAEANFIGTDVTGTADLGNASSGILIFGDSSTIGSLGVGGNLISGNDASGISATSGTSIAGLKIVGNRIGTTADESTPLANDGEGIATLNAVGAMIQDNVIGGNGDSGIVVEGVLARIFRNFIGTNSNGDDLGNAGSGIEVVDAPNSAIGSATMPGNTIAYNAANGIFIDGCSLSCLVDDNTIGSSTVGENAGNGFDGIFATDSTDLKIYTNVIGENGANGITIAGGSASTGNPIIANSTFGNAGIGIDLGADGPTPNDVGDFDTGANKLQNSPVFDPEFTKYNDGTGQIEVRYRVDTNITEATYPLRVDFYLADADGEEGAQWLGIDFYPGASAGSYRSFAFAALPGPEYESEMILATARDSDDNTGEFGDAVPLPEPGAIASLVSGGLLLVALERRRAARALALGSPVATRKGAWSSLPRGRSL